ncbi:hypothetical protein SLEP1_g29677 [Rubroshorea leprosula]|uniref:Uncharacterized protein n=1 Tax=Rubroshorea leprosula TaxID=152421 RepID=A0AAV5JXR5_9ROSI|nr:hypothetical protein SLEP1_g29677 [Rubroshorea leprosula]
MVAAAVAAALEADDPALLDLIPFLECFCFSLFDFTESYLALCTDVARKSPSGLRPVLKSYERKDIAKEFLERSKGYQSIDNVGGCKNRGSSKEVSGVVEDRVSV